MRCEISVGFAELEEDAPAPDDADEPAASLFSSVERMGFI